jgi:hypothetical protein
MTTAAPAYSRLGAKGSEKKGKQGKAKGQDGAAKWAAAEYGWIDAAESALSARVVAALL